MNRPPPRGTKDRASSGRATPPPSAERFSRTVAVAGGVAFALAGLWAFAAPESFFETAATFEPYNEHLIRDIGAFQIGLGAVLLLAAVKCDALVAALAGTGIGATFHVAGHWLDRDLGGDPAVDIPTFAVLALLLLAAALVRHRARSR